LQSLALESRSQSLARDAERANGREQQERASSARFQYGESGVDDRVRVLDAVRRGQAARNVEESLRRVVERAVPAAGGCLGETEL